MSGSTSRANRANLWIIVQIAAIASCWLIFVNGNNLMVLATPTDTTETRGEQHSIVEKNRQHDFVDQRRTLLDGSYYYFRWWQQLRQHKRMAWKDIKNKKRSLKVKKGHQMGRMMMMMSSAWRSNSSGGMSKGKGTMMKGKKIMMNGMQAKGGNSSAKKKKGGVMNIKGGKRKNQGGLLTQAFSDRGNNPLPAICGELDFRDDDNYDRGIFNTFAARSKQEENGIFQKIEEHRTSKKYFYRTGRNVGKEFNAKRKSNAHKEDIQDGGPLCTPNVLETASMDPNLSIFVELISLAGGERVQDYFLCAGPFTLLAPSNDAFDLNNNPTLLQYLFHPESSANQDAILYHILPGTIETNDFRTGSTIRTLQGDELMVKAITLPTTTRPLIRLDDKAMITLGDIPACNGIIHVIDEFLIPPAPVPAICNMLDFRERSVLIPTRWSSSSNRQLQLDGELCEPNVLAVAAQNDDVSIFVHLVDAAGLEEIFLCAGPFTVLVPSNDAFYALGQDTLDTLLDEDHTELLLQDVLLYHILPGLSLSDDFVEGPQATLLRGSNVFVGTDPVQFNGADLQFTDVLACNGVIHVVRSVLLPTFDTLAPTQAPMNNNIDGFQPTMIPSVQPSESPEGAIIITDSPTKTASMVPTSRSASMAPTLPAPTFPSASLAPTNSRVSMAPTAPSVSMAPTSPSVSMPPTFPRASMAPTFPSASMAPTPTVSMDPTIVLSKQPTAIPSVLRSNFPSTSEQPSLSPFFVDARVFIAYNTRNDAPPLLEDLSMLQVVTETEFDRILAEAYMTSTELIYRGVSFVVSDVIQYGRDVVPELNLNPPFIYDLYVEFNTTLIFSGDSTPDALPVEEEAVTAIMNGRDPYLLNMNGFRSLEYFRRTNDIWIDSPDDIE